MSTALGLVETRGLVAAIEAADAMLKASNVKLIGKEVTKAALITIKVTGDVAAVQSAVDAGAAAAQRVGELISTHIIPQPDKQIVTIIPEIDSQEVIFQQKPKIKEKEKISVEQKSKTKPIIEIKSDAVVEKPKAETSSDTKKEEQKTETASETIARLRKEALGEEEFVQKEVSEEVKEISVNDESPKINLENLESLNVHLLRKLARSTEGFPIQGREISRANRSTLLGYFEQLK